MCGEELQKQADQLVAGLDAELLQDVGLMKLRGARADRKDCAYLIAAST